MRIEFAPLARKHRVGRTRARPEWRALDEEGRGMTPRATKSRKAGRPSLSGRTAVSPQVTFRMPPALRAAAERLAAQRGTTLSGLAREALEELVRHSA